MINVLLFKFRQLFRHVVLLGMVGVSIFLTGCVYGPPYYGPPPHYHYHPDIYDYYYYPGAQVYFHFTTGVYYYREGGVWVTARILPAHIHLDATNRVRIRVESDRPYVKFNEHSRIYRPAPNYRMDLEQSRKEREANQRWYQEYDRKYPRDGKRRDKLQ